MTVSARRARFREVFAAIMGLRGKDARRTRIHLLYGLSRKLGGKEMNSERRRVKDALARHRGWRAELGLTPTLESLLERGNLAGAIRALGRMGVEARVSSDIVGLLAEAVLASKDALPLLTLALAKVRHPWSRVVFRSAMAVVSPSRANILAAKWEMREQCQKLEPWPAGNLRRYLAVIYGVCGDDQKRALVLRTASSDDRLFVLKTTLKWLAARKMYRRAWAVMREHPEDYLLYTGAIHGVLKSMVQDGEHGLALTYARRLRRRTAWEDIVRQERIAFLLKQRNREGAWAEARRIQGPETRASMLLNLAAR